MFDELQYFHQFQLKQINNFRFCMKILREEELKFWFLLFWGVTCFFSKSGFRWILLLLHAKQFFSISWDCISLQFHSCCFFGIKSSASPLLLLVFIFGTAVPKKPPDFCQKNWSNTRLQQAAISLNCSFRNEKNWRILNQILQKKHM